MTHIKYRYQDNVHQTKYYENVSGGCNAKVSV